MDNLSCWLQPIQSAARRKGRGRDALRGLRPRGHGGVPLPVVGHEDRGPGVGDIVVRAFLNDTPHPRGGGGGPASASKKAASWKKAAGTHTPPFGCNVKSLQRMGDIMGDDGAGGRVLVLGGDGRMAPS